MRVVRAVTFDASGVTVEYLAPDEDVRVNGVILNHAVFIPGSDDYDAGIEDVRNAVVALLDDVLADVLRVPAMELAEPDDDDLPSDYDNPLER